MIDLLIYVVGYEERSGYIASGKKITVGSRVGLVFRSYQECWFDKNYFAAQARGDVLIEIDRDRTTQFTMLKQTIVCLRAEGEGNIPLKIGVDVSSMTRELMSSLLRYLFDSMQPLNLRLVLLYATAKYQEPPGDDGPYVDFQPISGCEGWTLHPERPLSAILGLGYEADQAIGTVEYLDPSGIWAFIPNGEDARFRRDLNRA